MASVVGAVGSSHSPQVSLPAVRWRPYGDQEVAVGRIEKSQYNSTRAGDLETELTDAVFEDRAARCDRSVAELHKAIDQLKPDVLVVVGDDQHELFLRDGIPAFAFFTGDELVDLPPGMAAYPPLMEDAYYAYHADGPDPYVIAGGLSSHIARELTEQGIDVTVCQEQPKDRGFGHAFTFIRLRLMQGTPCDMVPIFVNTYFPPNQPTPARCLRFGHELRLAIESWGSDARVLLVASGGLSHPVVDEELDRDTLDALERGDTGWLTKIPRELLEEGNSEIRNWIIVAGAMADCDFRTVDYVPGYRSLEGSGCGMGFGIWSPRFSANG